MSQSSLRQIVSRTANAVATIACVASMFIAAGSGHAQDLYQPPSSPLTTGRTPQGVAAADFTRSGLQSLVVTDSGSSNMEVYIATDPGTFAPAVPYSTCAGPTAVLAVDINSDGYPDIIVACPSSGTVDIFFNDGASNPGAFGAANPYTSKDPVAMVAGDFRGDGQIDLVVAIGTGGITFFKNNNGTFTTSTGAAAGGVLSGITAGDFNHDGILDIALSDSGSNNVHVLLGTGTGTFGTQANYSAGATTTEIQTADFNRDGNLDLAVTAGNNVSILKGSATGVFTLFSTTAAGTNPVALAVTDVNSDGKPDVVAFDSPSSSTGAVAVLLGNGDGTLQTAQIDSQTFVPGTLAAVADFNHDGKPDLALTAQNDNQVNLLLNNTLQTQYPDGRSFAAANELANGYGNMADSVALGDFNKDGHLDIAVSYLEDNAVRVLLNNGAGNFNTAVVYPVGQQPYWVASGDLNGDGYPDLVTANTTVAGATGTVSVLLNNGSSGNGTFKAAATYTVGKQPYQVAIGDVNGDGYPDLAVTNYGANTASILFGSKTGTFTLQPTALSTCANPYGVAIGDFEHNGFPSVAVSCYSSAQIEVFPNNGNGTFGSPVILTTDVHPASLVVGDFNRDGKLDIVVGNTTANDVYFFAGNGKNGFAAGVESSSLNFPDSIAAGDVNGDGILDIVGVAPNFNNVVVTLGVGDGTFGTFQQRSAGEFPAVKQPWAVALGDFNNDGQLDIVTANTYNQVNIASPAYQSRYIAEYPPIPAGNPSIDVLTNASAVNVTVTTSPASPIPDNNTSVTLQATAQPAVSGPTPTGSVIFELETPAGTVLGSGSLSGGVASFDTDHLDTGSYQFTALYSGDSNFQPATAVPMMITVSSSVPTSGTTCNGTYTGNFGGNITVSPGQNCDFTSGGVGGNITNNGGNVSLTNSNVGGNVTSTGGNLTIAHSTVGGNVTVNSGTFTIGPGSTIGGNLQIQNLPTGPGPAQICGSVVHGNLLLQDSGTAVLIGNPTSCAANTISGNLQVNNNTAATTLNGNTVGGNLTDSTNTAPTQVFNNTINGNLTCQANSSITGGGNKANSKLDQCATF